jgi:hypothetical protein
MRYIIFYITILISGIGFLFTCHYRQPNLRHLIIGLTSVGYSLLYEILFGIWAKLYYYLDISNSALYLAISSILIYPILNMIYVLFLPHQKVLLYTIFWIIGMLLFEYFSLLVRIIIFTGWQPVPWSLVTYMVTYLWIYYFYRYLEKRIPYIHPGW